MRPAVLQGYLHPPQNPESCIFAQTTACLSADLKKRIVPCQFGGDPDCSQCGCMASAGLDAVGRYELGAGVTAGKLFWMSHKVGNGMRRVRGQAV